LVEPEGDHSRWGARGSHTRGAFDADRRRSAVEFGILGPLPVMGAGGSLALGGARQRAVLALLLVQALFWS
jgi:hypothetical protein